MIVCQADNINSLFLKVLQSIKEHGVEQKRRGGRILEVHPMLCVLTQTNNNVLIMPHRGNNFFATLYETFWVLSGREEIASLSYFLPRAPEYSDNGNSWRGAYGPRLRKWLVSEDGIDVKVVDQIAEVVKMLRKDPSTRRAQIVIYNPGQDFCDTLDTPCNIALHFSSPDGVHLDLEVFNRSNDAYWGFLINFFEWTTLLQIVAWLSGLKVGTYYHFTSNMHVYERHWGKMDKILAEPEDVMLGLYGQIQERADGPLDRFSKTWFVDPKEVFGLIEDFVKQVFDFVQIPLLDQDLPPEMKHLLYSKAKGGKIYEQFLPFVRLCFVFKLHKDLGTNAALTYLSDYHRDRFGADAWYWAGLDYLQRNFKEKEVER